MQVIIKHGTPNTQFQIGIGIQNSTNSNSNYDYGSAITRIEQILDANNIDYANSRGEIDILVMDTVQDIAVDASNITRLFTNNGFKLVTAFSPDSDLHSGLYGVRASYGQETLITFNI